MRRSANAAIWVGLAITLVGLITYVPVFVRFPATRDIPWVNLLLLAAGGWLIAAGIRRAYRQPERYRGKVSGVVLGGLWVALCGLFCWGNFIFARQVPAAAGAPEAGQTAPDFILNDAAGKPVSLAALRQANRAVLLIFYRGYW